MHKTDTPTKVSSTDESGQLPTTHYVIGEKGDGYSVDRLFDEPAWAEEDVRAYAAEQVASERKRWRTAVQLVLSQIDALPSDMPLPSPCSARG